MEVDVLWATVFLRAAPGDFFMQSRAVGVGMETACVWIVCLL